MKQIHAIEMVQMGYFLHDTDGYNKKNKKKSLYKHLTYWAVTPHSLCYMIFAHAAVSISI